MAEIINTINVEGEDYDVMPRLAPGGGLEIIERCDFETGTLQNRLGVRLNEYGGLRIGTCDNSLGIKLSNITIVRGEYKQGNPLHFDTAREGGSLQLKIGSGLEVACDGTLYATSEGSCEGSSGGLGACSNVGNYVGIGCHTSIGGRVSICSNVSIGRCSRIDSGLEVRHDVYIGGETNIGCVTSIGSRVKIGDYIRINGDCGHLQLKYSCDNLFATNGPLRIGDFNEEYLYVQYQGRHLKIKCEPA